MFIMRSVFSSFTIILWLLGSVGFAQDTQSDPGEPKDIVARAGDIIVTRSQLSHYLANLPADVDLSTDSETLRRVVDVLIQRAVLERRALAEGLDKETRVSELLAIGRQTVLADAYLERVLRAKISEEDILTGYEEYTKSVVVEAQIKARHILLPTRKAAVAVIAELNAGADFEILARTRSTGPSAAQGGDLGYFGRERMVPQFAAAAFAMDTGEYSQTPVQTEFGWHVILVEDKRTQAPLPLEDMRPQIEQALLLAEIEGTLQELMQDVTIEYLNLESLLAGAEN